MKLDELCSKVSELRDQIADLSEIENITDEDDAILSEKLNAFETLSAELVEQEQRAARIAAAKASVVERASGIDQVQVMRQVEPKQLDLRTATRGELKDAALKMLETDGRSLVTHQADHVDKLLRTQSHNVDGSKIARRMVITESDAYRSAFMKAVSSTVPAWTAEEAAAVNEYRAMSEGTDTAGGFGIPVLVDPTILLTSGAAAAPVLNIARTVTITTDEWKGVSSAGVSWSYDAEAAQVSDDAPTLAQPSIPVYKAAGFVPFSLEIGQDYPSFAEEMRALLDQGYIDLVAAQTITGSGSSQPFGIFTAIDQTAASEVKLTTAGTFAAVDLLKLWKSVPERYRGNASWIMSAGVENQIRSLAATSDGAYYTVNLAEGGIGNLFGRPVYTTDYAPDWTGTTGVANILVCGDFSNFVIAQRAGMTLELVPHLFGANSRPTGQRGFYAVARHGFDSVNDNGFRLLQNT